MIILDYQDRRPIYEQVTERFRILIYREALPAGSRLPSVRQLAMDLSINPNTIQRAYAQLEKEGLIYPVKGKGNFVADTQQIKKKNREDYRRELMETVQKGKSLGFSEEELVSEVEHSYEEGEE
nr:GntR family transcriptional regulator [uncultured Blautia sp.]